MRTKIWLLLFFFCLSFLAFGQVPACVQLTSPADGSTDVSVFTNLDWEAVNGADGYKIRVGTSSGNNDIIDADVSNGTAYIVSDYLPPSQTLYVTITPYNASGDSNACTETTFVTRNLSPPRCTEIINPFDGHELVPVNANITWIRDFTANGYLMTIYEKDPNGIRVIENFDVGNGTNYKPDDFKPRTRYYVTIIPYNDAGTASGCQPITFTTGDPIPIYECPDLAYPLNGATNVALDPTLEWTAIEGIRGYELAIGTTPGGTQILSRRNVGDTTNFQLPRNLPQGTKIYISLAPYGEKGTMNDCESLFFTTKKEPILNPKDNIPGFFTPNNDGYNDVWSVGPQDYEIEKVRIFDRYGMLIRVMSANQGWDGTFNGNRLPSGSYWYSIQLPDAVDIQGFFLLKR